MRPVSTDTEAASTALADAAAIVERLIPMAGRNASPDLREHLAAAWFRKIELLRDLDRAEEAAGETDRLYAHFDPGPDPVSPPAALWLVRAMREKAKALMALRQGQAALEAMAVIHRRFGGSDAPEVREIVATSAVEEATLRSRADTPFAKVDMVRQCASLIEHFGKDARAGTRLAIAGARALQARLLAELEEHEAALTAYRDLQHDLAADPDPALREQAGDALLAEARLLTGLGQREAAREILGRIVAEFGDATHPGQRETLALAQMDLVMGLWLQRDRDFFDATEDAPLMSALNRLIHDHAASEDVVVLRQLNQALRLKAELLRASAADADGAEADAIADQQWAHHADSADPYVQREVLLAMIDRLDAQPAADALAGYRRMLERFGDSEDALLQPTLARVRALEGWALRQLQRPDEALAALTELERRYAASTMPPVHVWVVQSQVERARILREQGDYAGALAALERLPGEDLVEEGSGGSALRQAIVRAMALRVELWQAQVPPPPEKVAGEEEQAASGPPHVAQLQQAIAVDELCRWCATNMPPEVGAVAANALYDLAVELRRHRHFQRAADTYVRYVSIFADDTSPAIEATTASAYLNHAYLLMELMNRPEAALAVYDALLDRFANATSEKMRATLAKAAASRLTCLNRLQRQGAAPSYGEGYPDVPLEQRTAISDTIARGKTLADAGRYRDAIAFYDQVLAEHKEALHPELRRLSVDAMVRKAYCLSRLAQREAALALSDESIARYGKDLSTTIEKDVALAMSYRALQLDRLGRHAEEVQTYDEIIARWSGSDVPFLRERVADARFSKAVTIADTDLQSALALYRQVIIHLGAPEKGLRRFAAKAAAEAIPRLGATGRDDEAIAIGEALVHHCGGETDPALLRVIARGRIALADSYKRAGQNDHQAEQIEALLAMPAAAVKDSERALLRTEHRQLRPRATLLGRAAQAFGDYFRD